MLFDDLDKKIKEAAEQHHPAYDERAWQKMEKLLNEHLPQQKDDRRRVVFLVLLFLLIGGGAFLVISKPWNKQAGPTQLVSTNQTSIETSTNNKPNNSTNNVTTPQVDKADRKIVPGEIEPPLVQTQKPNKVSADVASVVKRNNGNPTNVSGSKEDALTETTTVTSNNTTTNKMPSQENKIAETNNTDNPILKSSTANSVNEQKEKINNSNAVQRETKPVTDQQAVKADEKKTSAQKSLRPKNYFSFFASAGPDVSKAGSSKTGKTTLAYGLGVGYTMNRITLRTGIFASKKIYWANANDYELSHPIPPTVKFVGADANCDVVEVPLKVSYSFVEKGKNSVFGGAGLSSYFMKKEKYVYNYETGWGTSYTYPYETKNENKHYFSVLNLSAGYSREISKTVSLTAEPYVDVPLVGIGVGKVHLNSAGVLFTVSVKPFKK